jgi:hypothetical protein
MTPTIPPAIENRDRKLRSLINKQLSPARKAGFSLVAKSNAAPAEHGCLQNGRLCRHAPLAVHARNDPKFPQRGTILAAPLFPNSLI